MKNKEFTIFPSYIRKRIDKYLIRLEENKLKLLHFGIKCLKHHLLTKRKTAVMRGNKLKFGYSEKATKFEKIFFLRFDATQ